MIAYGANRGRETGIQCAWQPSAGGYTLEFFIPAAVLRPARMQVGTKLGMNFALNNDGKAVEQFYSDKDVDRGYRTPISWGAVRLAE